MSIGNTQSQGDLCTKFIVEMKKSEFYVQRSTSQKCNEMNIWINRCGRNCFDYFVFLQGGTLLSVCTNSDYRCYVSPT